MIWVAVSMSDQFGQRSTSGQIQPQAVVAVS